LVLVAYRKFPGEPWTCGWGHTGKDVVEGTTCTPEQAGSWFASDTHAAVASLDHHVTVPLNQNQFDALVSFTFNVGIGAEEHTTRIERIELTPGEFEALRRECAATCMYDIKSGVMSYRDVRLELSK